MSKPDEEGDRKTFKKQDQRIVMYKKARRDDPNKKSKR
jgi:hypothetical protein